MLMNGQPDLLELLLGKNQEEFLTSDGDLGVFAPATERDQALDMDSIIDPADPTSLLFFGNYGGDEQAPQISEQVVEIGQAQEPLQGSLPSEVPQFSGENLIFQFPSTTVTDQQVDPASTFVDPSNEVTVEIMEGDLTDAESVYSVQVPSTPYTPLSPTSVPPQTPDTASSMDSSYSGFSGNVPSFNKLGDCVKSSLKMAIRTKRQREGKGDINIQFVPPPPEQLTQEEEAKRCEKREKNKLAAQKCREKKRARIEELEAETKKLKHRQNAYKLEVQKLIDERDKLIDIINIHSQVCPHLRTQTAGHI